MSKYTLHGIALSGPTYKVALMLTLAGQPFRYRHVNLRGGEHKQPEFLALNRYGQVPVLEHGGVALCQSGAILQYLADTLGRFGGDDAVARLRAREWLFWDADKLSPGIYRTRAAKLGFAKFEPPVEAVYQAAGEAALKDLDGYLTGQSFLVQNSPTIADIACWGVLAFAGQAGFDLAQWPNVAAWAARMTALPGALPPSDLLPMNDRD